MLSSSSASVVEYRVKSRFRVFIRMMATTAHKKRQSMKELTMENQWTLCSKNFGSRYRSERVLNALFVLYQTTEYVKLRGAPSYTGHGLDGSMSTSMIWFSFLKIVKRRCVKILGSGFPLRFWGTCGMEGE